MKVAFNILPLQTGHKTRGVGSYTKNLLNSLKKRSDIQIQEFIDIKEVKNADVIHYPFFDLFQKSLPLRKKIPIVVTIHDVTPLVFPQHYPSGVRGKINTQLQKLALRNIKAIITDSYASKEDIIKYLHIDKEKIFPVYLAPAEHFKPIKDLVFLSNLKQKYSLPHKFVIYVGDVNWNKNLLNLTQACIDADVDVVFVGKSFEQKIIGNHAELKSFAKFIEQFSHNPLVHLLGFVSDDDLVGLMNVAEATLLPSFYEGFGLTILESQSCGTPVITSDVSSMPEVAGIGALLVDPNNVNQISNAVKQVIDDQSLRDNLIRNGFENIKRFSWDKTAQEMIKVYECASK